MGLVPVETACYHMASLRPRGLRGEAWGQGDAAESLSSLKGSRRVADQPTDRLWVIETPLMQGTEDSSA